MPEEQTSLALEERIAGGLAGAVIGDALGAITETLSRRQIGELYGWLDDFVDFRFKPFGQDRTVGAFTDDASLVLAMTNSIIDEGSLTSDGIIRHLMNWASNPALAQFSGPSTKRAIQRINAGEDPRLVGMGDVHTFTGASNGGAMKSAPAGWSHPGDISGAAAAAALICTPTHNTQMAIGGAAAIAAACAVACTQGAQVTDLAAAAIEGAGIGVRIGLEQGREVAGPNLVRRIEQAVSIAQRSPDLQTAVIDIADFVGSGLATSESVPAAIALVVAAKGDVNQTAIAAANIGDDTDTIGTMAAAISGTYSGIGKVNPEWLELVERINGLEIVLTARSLVAAVNSRENSDRR